MADSQTPKGQFTKNLSKIVEGYDATLALLVARGSCSLPDSGARILVPITGTAVSRRGAEVAFVLARALEASVTALYVTRSGSRRVRRMRFGLAQRNEEAVLKDIVRLAARYGVDIRTAIETNSSPDAPIEKYSAEHDLIVMGVNRRPGDVLFLGNTASTIAAQRTGPILFVAEAE